MNLRPWQLWTPDGKPAEGTEEIVSVLESVLKRDPNHLGANHYYIHAVEASKSPEKALAAANRLQKLAPSAGHLTHMPAHIYARVGDHAASANSNRLAADADKRYLAATGVEGVYPDDVLQPKPSLSRLRGVYEGRLCRGQGRCSETDR
jgi:hypothetical protein